MTQGSGYEAKGRLSPSAAAAFAAAGVSATASLVAFVLWSVLPSGQASTIVIALPFILAPFLVAAAAWIAAQGAVRALLAPMVDAVARLGANDVATPVVPNAIETAPLAAALEQCRAAVADRQRTARAHGAVARLLGAAISRLAEGDLKTRITVDLPEPYKAFRDDFNRAMEELETALARSGDMAPRLDAQAGEIAEAADQLSRRAVKLEERIAADIVQIEANAARDPQEALRIATHTLGGVRVASRRNQDAATHFANLAAKLAAEATRVARGIDATAEHPAGTEQRAQPQMPAASVPHSIGATVLKLRD